MPVAIFDACQQSRRADKAARRQAGREVAGSMQGGRPGVAKICKKRSPDNLEIFAFWFLMLPQSIKPSQGLISGSGVP